MSIFIFEQKCIELLGLRCMVSKNAKEVKQMKKGIARRVIRIAGVIIPVAVLLFYYLVVIRVYVVPTKSMEPTIKAEDIILSDGIAYKKKAIARQEVVLLKDGEETVVKRVIGIPGDEVVLSEAGVYVNGQQLYEPYLKEIGQESSDVYDVPAGCYFVLGDNRKDSLDSRSWENPYVEEERIVGKGFVAMGIKDGPHISFF